MAKKNETNETQTGDTTPEKTEDKKLEAFSFEEVKKENLPELAKAIWERIPGENYGDRASLANELISAIREARDSGKNTRVQLPVDEIVKNSINKSMAELQTVKVPLGGLMLPLSAIVRLTDESQKNVPMHSLAVKFLQDHKIKPVAEKKGSRGKATTYLRPLDYEPPAQEQEKKAA